MIGLPFLCRALTYWTRLCGPPDGLPASPHPAVTTGLSFVWFQGFIPWLLKNNVTLPADAQIEVESPLFVT